MNPVVLIPARLASTRLPGKPLADICDEPMIVHVWRRAMEADVGPVIVAVDDDRILHAVQAAGGRAVTTSAGHQSGTDRIAEALGRADPDGRHDVVVNFQGDLPTVGPGVPRAILALLATSDEVAISTAAARFDDPEEAEAAHIVKLVGTANGPASMRALYFSRSRLPWGEGPYHHHIGLYAWRRAALQAFVALPPSALEMRERLEQLRALEAGMRIDAALVDDVPLGVDTPAELERARAMLARRQ